MTECSCLPHPYGDGPEEDCPVHGRRPYAAEDQCKLVGAGDGSVLVYCVPCRAVLHPNAVTLNAVAGLWEEHTEAAHEPREVPSYVPAPDPWTDPDAAALAEPPPF